MNIELLMNNENNEFIINVAPFTVFPAMVIDFPNFLNFLDQTINNYINNDTPDIWSMDCSEYHRLALENRSHITIPYYPKYDINANNTTQTLFTDTLVGINIKPDTRQIYFNFFYKDRITKVVRNLQALEISPLPEFSDIVTKVVNL